MAEITRVITFLVIITFCCPLYPQDETGAKRVKRKVELIHADIYKPDEKLGRELGKFIGNVAFRDPVNGIIMTCDSAYFWQARNQLRAFSSVHIEQGDTLDIYGDELFYDGQEEMATIDGNVLLVDKETSLFTPAVKYDARNRIAEYTVSGKIINGDNTLTSRLGTYYVNEKMFHFKDSIRIHNPDYVMTADTMDYNTDTETVFFTGPAEVKGDSLYIYSEKGWYDTRNDITRIWQNAVINNGEQEVRGDSLFYNDSTGFGEAFRNVSITDTTDKVMVTGGYAWYYKDPERFLVTQRATFIQFSDNDSLFLHSDTITAVTVTDTSGFSYRLMRSWRKCRVFSADLQSRCDSLSYSFRDSVIRLYYQPVLWSEENQLTADSISIFTKNRKADRMELYNTAFVSSKIDSLRFNQIKGRNLTGFFRENKLYRIVVEGNGESVYYLVDNDQLIGVTHNKSSSIEIFVNEGKIIEITEFQNPDGKLDPPLLNPPDKMKLPGFSWLDNLRPKIVSDIYLK